MIKKGDTVPGIFSLILGVAAVILVLTNSKMTILGEAAKGGVGPGFFPFVCGIALIICGVPMILRGMKKDAVDYWQITEEKKQNLKIVGLMLILLLILLAAWKISELFFICLPIYVFAMNKLLKRSWLFSILFTLGMTAFIYGLFNIGFSIRFMP